MSKSSTVLTLRVQPETARRLAREARRRRQTRSQTARILLEAALGARQDEAPDNEARRQSRLASERASAHEADEFIVAVADLRGWQ
jgi:predicted transcriptional regulator